MPSRSITREAGRRIDRIGHDIVVDDQVARPARRIAQHDDLVAQQLDLRPRVLATLENSDQSRQIAASPASSTSPSASATPNAEAPRDSAIE